MNVLIIGIGKTLPFIVQSKFVNKIYFTNLYSREDYPIIKFNTFKELSYHCKTLKIDIVLIEDENLLLQGIYDFLKINFINCIGINFNFFEKLKIDNLRKTILKKYDILYPPVLKFPTNFPVYIKTNIFKKKIFTMQELIQEKKDINENYPNCIIESTSVELDCGNEKLKMILFFDGKNFLIFKNKNLSKFQSQKLEEYNLKIKKLFKDEQVNFIGFLCSNLVWHENDWYNLSFQIDFPQRMDIDFLYLLNSAIYQKLNEINL